MREKKGKSKPFFLAAGGAVPTISTSLLEDEEESGSFTLGAGPSSSFSFSLGSVVGGATEGKVDKMTSLKL